MTDATNDQTPPEQRHGFPAGQNPVAQGLFKEHGITLSAPALEALDRALPRPSFGAGFGGHGDHPGSVAAALPGDFWAQLASLCGPVVRYLVEVLLSRVPAGGVPAGTPVAAAVPASVWSSLSSLVGVVLTDVVRHLLAGQTVPDTGPAAPGA